METVLITYCSINNTWNVMKNKAECLYYGSIDNIEEWIDEHKAIYKADWQDFKDAL